MCVSFQKVGEAQGIGSLEVLLTASRASPSPPRTIASNLEPSDFLKASCHMKIHLATLAMVEDQFAIANEFWLRVPPAVPVRPSSIH
jgi:hypothetical protein